jgi:seryl-tRNA synthetase
MKEQGVQGQQVSICYKRKEAAAYRRDTEGIYAVHNIYT